LGCYDSLTRTITIHPRPLISITPDTNLCPGEYTSLLASGGSRYFWSPASQLSNDSIPNPTTTILSNGNYNLIVADLNSCQSYDSVKVSYYFLNPDFYFQDECIDTAVQFADSTQTDAGVVNVWRWIFDDGITSNIENPSHRYTIPNSYNVLLYIRTSEGCDTSITKVVTIFPLPSLNIPRYDSICVGESYQINADSLLKYVWDPNPTLTPWNTFNPIANPITTTNYFVTLTDSHFCVNRDSFRLKVNLLPNVNISAPPIVLCRGNSYQLNATTTAGSYLWHQGTALDDSTILNPTLSLTDSVTYWFQVTDYHGCTNYDTVTLNVQQPVLAEAFQDSTICRGNQVQLVADGGKYFSWTPNLYLTNASIKSPISTPDSSITYIIQVSNDCFSDDTSITIIVNQLPIANAGPDNTIYRNQSTTLSGSGGLSYSWTPDNYLNRPFEAMTVASPMYTTQYVLQVTDINGCISYDSVWIYVDGQTILLLPTAFSPDGNGVNDIFRITKWLNILSLETFEIYNRWGEMVFSTSDINAGWDGTFNGREQPLSVYSWIVKARDYEGNDVVKTGNVTLLR
jgi:gliding motility-associated-like protein